MKLKDELERPSFTQRKTRNIKVNSVAESPAPTKLPDHMQTVDLEGLTCEQRKLVSQLSVEQADAFSQNDDDIGPIPQTLK